MNKSTANRNSRRDRRRRQKRSANLGVTLLFAAIIALVGYLVWNSIGNRLLGERFPPYGAGVHVPNGNPLEPYRTDPPTSGPHYAGAMQEGFYEEDSQQVLTTPNPQGFIVHSMEHGYIIFWYNCNLVTEADCEALKTGIRSVMEGVDNFKVIAWPWPSLTAPVVATSWGYMLTMETWDAALAAQFYETNLNQAPEPFAR